MDASCSWLSTQVYAHNDALKKIQPRGYPPIRTIRPMIPAKEFPCWQRRRAVRSSIGT